MENSIKLKQKEAEKNFIEQITKLDALSPLKTLTRGYSIIEKNRKLIKSSKDLNAGDEIHIRLIDGNKKAKIMWERKSIQTMKQESFETKIKQLEDIVSELEKGDSSLEDSLKKFEEGMKISKYCNKLLQDAEKKITIILENNGELNEEDFDTEE